MFFLYIVGYGGNIYLIECLLLWFVKVNIYFFDVSGDYKNVGVNFMGQQCGREIFVDNCVYVLVIFCVSMYYWNFIVVCVNYDKILLDQCFNGRCFDNMFWFW